MLAHRAPSRYHLNQWRYVFQDLLLPPTCAGCQRVGAHWCEVCNRNVHTLSDPVCTPCGKPLASPETCADCTTHPPAFDLARSYASYEDPFRRAVITLKYHGSAALGEVLSAFLIQLLLSLRWEFDLILPVPLSDARRKTRGYNQAAFLATPIAYFFRRPSLPHALLRIRDTRSQVGLTGKERRENLQGAFWADETLANGRTILLVDDVFTTGSTLNACALALKEAGAARVFGLTLARPAHIEQDTWDL